jgi:hypothetical protein
MPTEPRQAPAEPTPPRQRIGRALAEAPLGIAAIGVVLAFAGTLVAVAALYLLATGGAEARTFVLFLLPAGLAGLYLGVKLVQRRPWARRALLVLLGLLAATALLRAATTPGLAYAVFAELIVLALVVRYLVRPRIARAFRPPA